MNHLTQLNELRTAFNSGITRSYTFRREQLLKLKKMILQHEQEIYTALYTDLKKVPEEAWFTENGLLLQELNHTLKHLREWMEPKPADTNLVNLPSSSKLYPSPLGVVLIIGPWNFPLQLLLIPLAGALAAGNTVVLKPSEHAPATAALISKMIKETFPPDIVYITEGDGATVIPGMMNAFRFDHVFYTGSIPVGRSIYQLAAKDLVPVTLELGGKDPCVVDADANLKVAARRIVLGKFSNAGQMCVSPDYLLVHQSVKEKLLELMIRYTKEFYSETPADNYGYTKIINERNFDRLVKLLGEGKIRMGGEYDRSRLYIAPTILDELSPDAPVMQEEIFGPILPVFTFNDPAEALSLISRNPNPLSFYVFTGSREKEKFWIEAVQFGSGCVNNTALQFTNHHLPFGGVGQSGIGRYHGHYSFETFTHYKAVMKTPAWFDPALKYPPLKGRLKLLKWLIR